MESKNKPTLYWSLLKFKDLNFYIASTAKGLVFVGSQNKPFEELSEWAKKRFTGSPLVEDDEKLEPYAVEITQYLEGKRKTFTVPFNYDGTAFQLAVWNALCEIPYGQTKSYSDIAKDINKPAAVRAVGTAIGANPVLITVPCHRVVGKNGSLTGYRGGLEMKTLLLDLERQALSSNE
ncbi:methylated-DNA-[protein]-cysteine S-methyltransferase [Cytobacillus horneckiae]|uniref:Methylated-DNA--protein-cysteine methyltransferase n=1 Tax=Cytobacillus horneckiae TaxID=549687 RepID=A0A2N0ZCG3_9BACI|nr:methylated-DNA--[protein]-cysteine S-methyltransferase [Cytobacillus horneckiae]MBN6889775.1 methylated-DNA--[protein]-cysteine S-methyltransferase [Cytobacillus horneckiae]MCM3180875.1 methylated-DNA--[protein]-cysteine S-methyltransferase [Cytobacillus horneckiae]MEC1158554.1 methylated-DNA--[protein]-cysteine S-methyltransferase [Cytobacillus horneckiae]MED2940861.1 methylated-DNA--[protein]-cysteine S-methyltransferase [Cytobacillus horneckiae]PKG27206.1 methylated-DNA--[protein]-cystei